MLSGLVCTPSPGGVGVRCQPDTSLVKLRVIERHSRRTGEHSITDRSVTGCHKRHVSAAVPCVLDRNLKNYELIVHLSSPR
jgi:hypothetical protein